MTDVQSGYADVNGARLYYETAGQGEPVVFVHAGIANSGMWDDQFDVFAQQYRVVRYDTRSFGRSSAPAGPASAVSDLAGLLDALGIARARLIGCSMGGATILDFALAHPERTAALVLVDAGMSGSPHGDDVDADAATLWQSAEAASKAGDFDRANELEMQIWVDGVGRSADHVDPAVRGKISAMNRALYDRDAEMNAVAWQEAETPAYGQLEAVQAPTLVILGDHDQRPVTEDAHTLAERIPGARLEIIADAAHLPNMEHPAEFNRLVLEFLAGV